MKNSRSSNAVGTLERIDGQVVHRLSISLFLLVSLSVSLSVSISLY